MSNNLGAPTLATNQLAKETTVNDAVGRIDSAMTERLEITVLVGSGNYDPTTSQLQQAVIIELIPDITTPPVSTDKPSLRLKNALKRFYVITNKCACAIAVKRDASNIEEVDVPPGESIIVVNRDNGASNQVLQISNGYLGKVKEPVRLAASTNVTIATGLNNGDTLDGLTLATGERVLLYGQTDPKENGIYIVAATPSRAPDTSFSGAVSPGALVPVLAGSDSGKLFICSNTVIPVIGTDNITFSALTSSPPYVVGTYIPGTPTASAYAWRHIVTDVKFFLPDNFVGSLGHVETNPSATTDFDVRRNGTSIGTVSVATGGAVTFSTSGSTNENFVSGDRLEIFAPAALNGLSSLSVTFRGTRN